MTLAPTWSVVPKKMRPPSPHSKPNRSPAQRIRFGEEEQQNERTLTFEKSRSKRYDACSDVARRVGFEPTWDYPKLISNQPRYDRFDTAAYIAPRLGGAFSAYQTLAQKSRCSFNLFFPACEKIQCFRSMPHHRRRSSPHRRSFSPGGADRAGSG